MILALRGPQEVWLLGWSFSSFCTFIHSDGFEKYVYGCLCVSYACVSSSISSIGQIVNCAPSSFLLPPSHNASGKQ